MRSIVIGAIATLAFAAAASTATSSAQGPYHLDSHGKCRDVNEVTVLSRLCAVSPSHPYCELGKSKQCGKTCIPLDQVCHKP